LNLRKPNARREPRILAISAAPSVLIELAFARLLLPILSLLDALLAPCPLSPFLELTLWATNSFPTSSTALLTTFTALLDTFEIKVLAMAAGGAKPLVKLVKIPLSLSFIIGINLVPPSLLGNNGLLLSTKA